MTKEVETAKRIYAHFAPMVDEGVLGEDMVGPLKRACLAAARDVLGKDETGKRDLIFEAVCSALGADWTDMPPHEAAKYNVAAKQLRQIGATPSDIIQRCRRYEAMHPDWELTATSLITHWSTLKSGGASTRVVDRVPVAETVAEPEPENLVGPPPEFLEALSRGVKAVPDC